MSAFKSPTKVLAFLAMIMQATIASPTAIAEAGVATAAGSLSASSMGFNESGISGNFPNNKATSWAQFCNDLTCNDCGSWVDVSNPGCLLEDGRQAVNIKRNTLGDTMVGLVFSPGGSSDQCNCQSSCKAIAGQGCYEFGTDQDPANTHSFRFVNYGSEKTVCAKNNC